MLSLKENLNLDKLPSHIAIIMDGNGRWAKTQGKPRVFGHKSGVTAVREVTEAAAELGIQFLTLYAFSTENWSRPSMEVNALMSLLVETVKREMATLNKNNIRLQAIGDLMRLPDKTRKALLDGIEMTKNNSRMTLVLALNYSSRWEIVEASKKIAEKVQNGELTISEIDSDVFSQNLTTKDIPDPELLIRTSGEHRISNYLLWQAAYAELYFTPVLWPDFRKEHFYTAILDYQNRERRFGKTSEQVAEV
ncbi:MAG: isoprenyl transferase [Saprospiraceae bacterium]|nr:isoprenyl transferase [Saprospiraceae bacterium]MBK8668447.1 isoprenyl transferase [Saprospiraceae bacterium]MBL0098774.1 isoprenyl transferase [Saprospiraceae bacterium]